MIVKKPTLDARLIAWRAAFADILDELNRETAKALGAESAPPANQAANIIVAAQIAAQLQQGTDIGNDPR